MPRNGSGVYSPDWVNAAPNTTIESAKQNAMVADLVADANAARPITAGGTAGTTAVEGIDNLSTKATNIASAATTDIGAATGRFVHITGTTTITALGTKTAGVVREVVFDGALTLTHNATSLILFSGQNITTYAGLTMIFVSEGSGNWRELSHTTATGTYLPVVSFNSASVGITYTTQTGRWWRLGKTVSVEIYIVLSSKGSSGGPAAVSLPFAKESGQVGTAPVGLQVNFSGLTAGITGYINSAASTILLRAPSTTGSASVTDTNFTNTSEFSMFASYQVA